MHQCVCSIRRRDDMCVKWNESEGNGDSAVDDANVGLAEDNGVRWYAVTIGKRVGVFNHWCVIFLSMLFSMLISSLLGQLSLRLSPLCLEHVRLATLAARRQSLPLHMHL